MDSNKLTQMSRQAVTDAQALARRLSHNEVDTWHLLSALLGQENGIVPGLLEKMAITPSALQLAVERELERLPKVSGNVDTSKIYVTQAFNEALTKAEDEAKSLKDEYVSVEHLFLGLIEVGTCLFIAGLAGKRSFLLCCKFHGLLVSVGICTQGKSPKLVG